MIDIGGGSTELVIGTGHARCSSTSPIRPAWCARPSATCTRIRLRPSELDALARDVREILRAGVPEEWRRAVQHAIAVAGTATSMASIAQELEPYDPDKVEGYVLSVSEVPRDLRAAGRD